MVHFGEFLKIWSLRSNSVTRQISFNRTKIGGKCQNKINSNVTFWGIFEYCAHIVFENGPNHTWYCDNSGIITFHFPFLGHFLVLWAQQCFQLCRGSHKLFCLQKVSFNLSRKRRRRKGPLISCYGSILYHNYISSFLFFLSQTRTKYSATKIYEKNLEEKTRKNKCLLMVEHPGKCNQTLFVVQVKNNFLHVLDQFYLLE